MNERTTLGWEIAGIQILVSFISEPVHPKWQHLFRSFKLNIDAPTSPEVALNLIPLPQWTNSNPIPEGASVWRSHRVSDGIQFDGPDYSGHLADRGQPRTGEFTLNRDSADALAGTVRCIVAHLLTERSTIFLHASGVIRNDSLLIFSGTARSGKTTIATELNLEGRPFSIDRVALVPSKTQVIAHQTPFSDDSNLLEKLPPRPPKGVVFIEQSENTSLERLSPVRGAQLLLRHSYMQPCLERCTPKLVETAANLVETTPVFSLRFQRSGLFWDLLDGNLPNMDTHIVE